MSAIALVARTELRRRWLTTVAVALLVGVVGAVVLSSLAGARRSSSSLHRFNEFSKSADIEVTPGKASAAQLDEFRKAPGVAAVAVLRIYAVQPTNSVAFLAIGAPVDQVMNNEIDRPRLVAGRLADPSRADEVDIGESIANIAHLRVGGTFDLQSYTNAGINRIFATGHFTKPDGPFLRLHIVGIVRRPLDLGARSAAGGVVVLTPGFNTKYGNVIGTFNGYALRVRTVTPADIARVSARAEAIFGRLPGFEFQTLSVDNSGADGAIRVLTAVLLIFAGVALVAGVAAIGIVLNRELSTTYASQPTLLALGLTRRDRFSAAMVRVVLIAVIGGGVAVFGALVASPLFPFGVARRADPDAGFHADWLVLGFGALAVLITIMAIGAWGAWRSTLAEHATRAARRPGFAARSAAVGGGPGLPVTLGLRMATDPGRGERAVPLRSAFVAVAFAVAGLTAVSIFAASLERLAVTPRRYGATFDFKTETTTDALCQRQDHGLAKNAGIASLAAICTENIQLDSRATIGWGELTLRGAFGPEVVSGHAPATATEVAVGASTLAGLHKRLGDTVVASAPTGRAEYRIVGTVIFPLIGDAQALADGAWFTQPGLDAVLGHPTDAKDSNTSRYLVGTFARGANRAAVTAAITRATYDPASNGLGNAPSGPRQPVEVSRLRQTNWFPGAVAALLAVLAIAAVGHALITSILRRRRELALLKTLGFERAQIRWSIASQATVLAIAGIVVGVPFGVLAGAAIWRAVANGLGVNADALVPLAILALVPIVVIALNLVAYFPARTAARTKAAVALRSE